MCHFHHTTFFFIHNVPLKTQEFLVYLVELKIGNHQKSIRVGYIKKISSTCKLGFKCMQQWLWVFALLNDNIVF